MAAGNQWKHLAFTLALSKRVFSLFNLKTFPYGLLLTHWFLRTRKHMANRYFRTRNMLPRNNADVTHCENFSVLFSKQSCLPSWRQASRYTFKNDFYLVKIRGETFSLLWAFPYWRWGEGFNWLVHCLYILTSQLSQIKFAKKENVNVPLDLPETMTRNAKVISYICGFTLIYNSAVNDFCIKLMISLRLSKRAFVTSVSNFECSSRGGEGRGGRLP